MIILFKAYVFLTSSYLNLDKLFENTEYNIYNKEVNDDSTCYIFLIETLKEQKYHLYKEDIIKIIPEFKRIIVPPFIRQKFNIKLKLFILNKNKDDVIYYMHQKIDNVKNYKRFIYDICNCLYCDINNIEHKDDKIYFTIYTFPSNLDIMNENELKEKILNLKINLNILDCRKEENISVKYIEK